VNSQAKAVVVCIKQPNNGVVSARYARRTASPLRGFAAGHAERWAAQDLAAIFNASRYRVGIS